MGARLPHPASDGAPGGLRWPALALLSWAACFAVWRLFGPDWPAAIVASGLGLILAGLHRQTWRRLIVAAGFPLALLFTGTDLPAWIWLIPLAVLVLAYPRRGWSDAPLFPTPHDALRALPERVPLHDGARVLDAGCGLGDGLMALRRAYPGVRLAGIEYSAVLWLLARLRCPWAEIARGDLWAQSWRDTDLVYLFQRPESMPRALDKARSEMRPDAWLVSLDFPLPGQAVFAQLETGTRHALYVYRGISGAEHPLPCRAQAGRAVVDKGWDGRDRAWTRARPLQSRTERLPCLSSSVGCWPWPASSACSSRTEATSAWCCTRCRSR